jgi:hypothetical protein
VADLDRDRLAIQVFAAGVFFRKHLADFHFTTSCTGFLRFRLVGGGVSVTGSGVE